MLCQRDVRISKAPEAKVQEERDKAREIYEQMLAAGTGENGRTAKISEVINETGIHMKKPDTKGFFQKILKFKDAGYQGAL